MHRNYKGKSFNLKSIILSIVHAVNTLKYLIFTKMATCHTPSFPLSPHQVSDTQTQTSQVFMNLEIGKEAWRDCVPDTNVIFNSISRSVVLMEFK